MQAPKEADVMLVDGQLAFQIPGATTSGRSLCARTFYFADRALVGSDCFRKLAVSFEVPRLRRTCKPNEMRQPTLFSEALNLRYAVLLTTLVANFGECQSAVRSTEHTKISRTKSVCKCNGFTKDFHRLVVLATVM